MKKKRLKKEQKRISEYLDQYAKNGAALYWDDEPSTPNQIGKNQVREEGCYMADYIFDDNGKVIEIRYDKVQ